MKNSGRIPPAGRPRISTLLAARSLNRFLLVGILNTLVAFAAFPAFFWLFGRVLSLNVLLVVSTIFCTLFSFATHRIVTFRSHGRVHHEVSRFFLLQGVIYVINVTLFNALLLVTRLHPVVIQWVIIAGLQIGNYFVLKRYVFPLRLSDKKVNATDGVDMSR